MALHPGLRCAESEDQIGEARRCPDATRTRPGLHEDGLDLRARNRGQRARDIEEASMMVDRMHLGRIGEPACLPVAEDRVRLDRPPQSLANRDELFHALIAELMLEQLIESVVLRIGQPGGRHDVEGDATGRDVIEAVEQPGHVERMHEGRRVGQAEADPLGHGRHRRDDRAHVVARPLDTPFDGAVAASLPRAGDARSVPEEQQIDPAAIRHLRELHVGANIGELTTDERARHGPAALCVREREIKGQVHAAHDAIACAAPNWASTASVVVTIEEFSARDLRAASWKPAP